MNRQKSALGVIVLAAICGLTQGGDGKSKNSVPGPTADIRTHNGAPALFIDGRAVNGLVYDTPPVRPLLSEGLIVLKNYPGFYGGREVSTVESFGNDFTLEADVCVRKINGAGANIALWINNSKRGCYFFHLSHTPDGNVVHLWKAHPGAWEFDKWFTLALNWREGDVVRLKLAVNGNRVSGYANGRPVGEKVDRDPLPPAPLKISAYHSLSTVDNVKITNAKGEVQLEDDFATHGRLREWRGLADASVPSFEDAGLRILRTGVRIRDFWQSPEQFDFGADYIRFNDESVVDAIAHFAGIIKRETDRKKIAVAHYAYHFLGYGPINYNQRGHHAMDRLLACADVDALASAYQYRVRQAGGSTVPITVVGSLSAHGKLWWLEDDTRTHLADEAASYNRARSLWETVNILKLVTKQMNGWTSVWCGVPDLPAALLRGIARSAGVHIYSEAEDFLCANNVMLAVHTRYAGKRTIRLPQVCKVTDAFTGELVAQNAIAFDTVLKQYETRMWWLE